jgi:transposase
MGRTKPPYAPEFRSEAARLAKTSGQPLRATAEHLGVSVEALRAWVKQADVDAGERDGLTTDERAELTRLRRENRVLRMERDLLKKATAFFARESEPTP